MKKKNPEGRDKNWFAKAAADAREALGKKVDERWYVLEYKPSGENSDGFWGSGRKITQSAYFDTEEEAQKFLADHEPSYPEYKLKIVHQECFERLERRWVGGQFLV